MRSDILSNACLLAKPVYQQIKCWSHGWQHIIRVERRAEELAKLENQNIISCGLASYFHDLGRLVEEQKGEADKSFGAQNHAILSIEPTVKFLQVLGIKGKQFGEIVEAVAVHSFKTYDGKNPVAKILRDADKSDALGPFGFLRNVRYFFGRDFVNTNDIIKYSENEEKISYLAEETLKILKSNELYKARSIDFLNFITEWHRNRMFETSSAYIILEKEIRYMERVKDFLEH